MASASIVTSIHAQDAPAVAEDRYETGVIIEPAIPRDEPAKRGGLEVRAAISAAYDSNIFLSRRDPQSDVVYQVSPSIGYSHGDAQAGEGGFVTAVYRPNGVVYTKVSGENRIDHDAALLAGWRGKNSAIVYKGALRQLGGATADSGRQVDRLQSAHEVRGGWSPVEKVTLELAAGNDLADYRDPALFDSQRIYLESAIRYAYSPKTTLGLAFRAGRLEVDRAGEQTTRQLTASIDWQPRQKIRVQLEGGAEERETVRGSRVNPVVQGRIEWAAADGTNLYLAGYRREEASAFLAGQNYSLAGVTAGISQRLSRDWTVRLEGGRETADYQIVDGTGSGSRRDAIWFVRPALEYRVSDRLDAALYYRVSANSSSSPDFGYDQRILGLELNYRF